MSRGFVLSTAHLAAWRRGFAELEPIEPCEVCGGGGQYPCDVCQGHRTPGAKRTTCVELFGEEIAECIDGWVPCESCHGRGDPRRRLAIILGIEIDVRVLDLALDSVKHGLTVRVRALGRELLFGRWRLPRYSIDGDDEIVERRAYPHEQIPLGLAG